MWGRGNCDCAAMIRTFPANVRRVRTFLNYGSVSDGSSETHHADFSSGVSFTSSDLSYTTHRWGSFHSTHLTGSVDAGREHPIAQRFNRSATATCLTLSLIAGAAAFYFLFTRDAGAWFRGRISKLRTAKTTCGLSVKKWWRYLLANLSLSRCLLHSCGNIQQRLVIIGGY
jgi:hypothetical protein